MDRFFTKLDLRDIKIDPFKTSFPPDSDDDEATDETLADVDAVDTGSAPEGWAARPVAAAWVADEVIETARPGAEVIEEVVVEETVLFATSSDLGDNGYVDRVVAIEGESVPYEPGDVLKVSARSRPSAVAGAIAGVVRELGRAEVQAIGAGATNQAIKAVAIARDYLRETGIDAVCLPAFIDVTIDNEDRTAIRLVVEPR